MLVLWSYIKYCERERKKILFYFSIMVTYMNNVHFIRIDSAFGIEAPVQL